MQRRFTFLPSTLVLLLGYLLVLLTSQIPTHKLWERLLVGLAAAVGLIFMVTAARQVRRGWLLPTLVGCAGILEVLGNRLLWVVASRGEAWAGLLSVGLSILGGILLLVAILLILQDALRQSRDPPWR